MREQSPMIRHLDLGTLRSVVAVVDTGGITRAAQRLHLTQSAVSMQIKRLEEHLEVPVFDRVGRGLQVTREGEQLVSYARKMLDINDEAIDRLTIPRHEGELSFGVPGDVVYPYIPAALRRFRREYPRVQVRFNTGMSVDLKEGLDDGTYDVILTTEQQADRGGDVLLRERLRWTGARAGRAYRQRPLPLLFTRTCMFRQAAVDALDQAGIGWIDGVDTYSEDASAVAAAADLGIRADLTMAETQGLEPVEHHGELPELPRYSVVMYKAGGENRELQKLLGGILKEHFSKEVKAS